VTAPRSRGASRAHELQVETLRLSQLAEQARARSAQIERPGRSRGPALDLQERRVAAEARFEELDMQLADSQERHAQLDERVIEAERRLAECREQQRTLERQAQEATFSQRSLEARRAELRAPSKPPQQARPWPRSSSAPGRAGRLSDAAAQGGLQDALDLKMERERPWPPAQRIRRPDRKLRASDERRQQLERSWTRCASASPNCSSRSRPRAWAWSSTAAC
jgi:chromosome segregation protein